MDDGGDLRYKQHWKAAVWALRTGYSGLVIALVGLMLLGSGSTPWILAIGVIIWLVSAVVTLVGFAWSRAELPRPRPGYWSMRMHLLHDTVHPRSAVRPA